MKFFIGRDQIPNDFIAASIKHIELQTPVHMHEFFEIEYIISGSGTCVIDGREYEFSEGCIFFLSPINTHEIKSADAKIFNVMFRLEECDESLSKSVFGAARFNMARLEGNDKQLAYYLLSEIVSVCSGDVGYAKLLLSCLLKKLGSFAKEDCPTPSSFTGRVLLYITENFTKGITLTSSAEHFGFTPTYFSYLFKQSVGINFSEYLDSIRFAHAKNLLLFTDCPILEVPIRSGFSDYSSFSRRFKKLFGLTPGEFRTK